MEEIVTSQPIIIASIGILASVVTASLSYYFTKRHQLKMEERRLKENFYIKFIESLSLVALDNNNTVALDKLADSFNNLLIIANQKTVEILLEFHNFVKIGSNVGLQRDSNEWLIQHDELLTKLIKEIRRDLLGKKSVNDKNFPNIHLTGRGKRGSKYDSNST